MEEIFAEPFVSMVRCLKADAGLIPDYYDYPLADVSLWLCGDGQEVEYDLEVREQPVPVTPELKAKVRDLFTPKEPIL